MSKVSLYLPDAIGQEAQAEARRTGRTISWILLRAWKLARREIRAMPSAAETERRVQASADR